MEMRKIDIAAIEAAREYRQYKAAFRWSGPLLAEADTCVRRSFRRASRLRVVSRRPDPPLR